MQIYTIFRKIASTRPQFLQHLHHREVRNQKLEVRFEISKIQNLVDLLTR